MVMIILRGRLARRAGGALSAALFLGMATVGCGPQGQSGGKMTEAEKARFNKTPTADQTAQMQKMQKMRAENQGKLEAAARAAQPAKR